MRARFQAELDQVTELLVGMADGVTDAMRRASAALLTADGEAAAAVLDEDAAIDTRYRRVEERLADLLARQAPVASDLRLVIAALHSSGDLERMGDLAVHVARTAQRRAPQSAVVPEVRGLVIDLADRVTRMGAKVSAVLRNADAGAAAELEGDDDAVDDLNQRLFEVLLDRSWPHGVGPAIDAAQLGRWYERYADHAVNAGRQVIYLVTGEDRRG